jgi:hypothetical protein
VYIHKYTCITSYLLAGLTCLWCLVVLELWLNEAKSNKFSVNFVFINKITNNLTRFFKNSQIKPTLNGLILGRVTLHEVYYIWVDKIEATSIYTRQEFIVQRHFIMVFPSYEFKLVLKPLNQYLGCFHQ